MAKRYPDKPIFDLGSHMLSAMGTFWSVLFDERDLLRKHYADVGQLEYQNYVNLLETIGCMSRREVPLMHRQIWQPLRILRSEMDEASTIRYGQAGLTYGGGQEYGGVSPDRYAVAVADESIGMILNRIAAPSITWINGQDFFLEDGVLEFVRNPFDDNRVSSRAIYDSSGVQTDTEITLWAFNSKQDWEYLHYHFGYVLNRRIASTQFAKDLVNAVWDAYVDGPSVRSIRCLLGAVAGVPLVIEPQETVEDIQSYPDRLVIVTDSHVYTFHPSSRPVVCIGDTVKAADALVDTLQIMNLTKSGGVDEALSACVGSAFSYPSPESVPLVTLPDQTGWAMFNPFASGSQTEGVIDRYRKYRVVTYVMNSASSGGSGSSSSSSVSPAWRQVGDELFECSSPDDSVSHCVCLIPVVKENQGSSSARYDFMVEFYALDGTLLATASTQDSETGWTVTRAIGQQGLYALACGLGLRPSIAALAFDDSFISGGYQGELVFENRTVDIDYGGLDDDGKAIVTFHVGGMQSDVDQFWEDVHERGKLTSTLAELLDTRTNPTSQPTPQFLPAEINPLQFVMENLLANNMVVARIRHSLLPDDAAGTRFSTFLRDLVPPQTMVYLVVDAEIMEDGLDTPSDSESIEDFEGAAFEEAGIPALGELVQAFEVEGTLVATGL